MQFFEVAFTWAIIVHLQVPLGGGEEANGIMVFAGAAVVLRLELAWRQRLCCRVFGPARAHALLFHLQPGPCV